MRIPRFLRADDIIYAPPLLSFSATRAPLLQWPFLARLFFEFAVIVVPTLLGFSCFEGTFGDYGVCFADHAWMLTAGMVAASVALHLISVVSYREPLLAWALRPGHALYVVAMDGRKAFLSAFRGALMLSV